MGNVSLSRTRKVPSLPPVSEQYSCNSFSALVLFSTFLWNHFSPKCSSVGGVSWATKRGGVSENLDPAPRISRLAPLHMLTQGTGNRQRPQLAFTRGLRRQFPPRSAKTVFTALPCLLTYSRKPPPVGASWSPETRGEHSPVQPSV